MLTPDKLVTRVRAVPWFDDRYYEIVFANGEKDLLVSVSTVVDEWPDDGLARFRGDVGNREADMRMGEAADRGSRIHQACNIIVRGGIVLFQHPDDAPQDGELNEQNRLIIQQCKATDTPYFLMWDQVEFVAAWRFYQWHDRVRPDYMAAEKIVYSLEHRIAGRLDFQAYHEGGTYFVSGAKPVDIPHGVGVWDYKSGYLNEPKFRAQLAGYAECIEQTEGVQVDFTGIIHLKAQTTAKEGIEGVKTIVVGRDQWKEDFGTFLNLKRLFEIKHPNDKPKIFSFPSYLIRGDATRLVPSGFVQPAMSDVVDVAAGPLEPMNVTPGQPEPELALKGEENGKKRYRGKKHDVPVQ